MLWGFLFVVSAMQEATPDPQVLQDLVKMEMPFGKYKGRKLVDIPEHYLLWFKNQGFPKGKLGERLQLLYEIKLNGLEHLLRPLRK